MSKVQRCVLQAWERGFTFGGAQNKERPLKGASVQNAQEIPERCTFGLAFLSLLIPDVLRCGWSLNRHNTHEYISAKWCWLIADVVIRALGDGEGR